MVDNKVNLIAFWGVVRLRIMREKTLILYAVFYPEEREKLLLLFEVKKGSSLAVCLMSEQV